MCIPIPLHLCAQEEGDGSIYSTHTMRKELILRMETMCQRWQKARKKLGHWSCFPISTRQPPYFFETLICLTHCSTNTVQCNYSTPMLSLRDKQPLSQTKVLSYRFQARISESQEVRTEASFRQAIQPLNIAEGIMSTHQRIPRLPSQQKPKSGRKTRKHKVRRARNHLTSTMEWGRGKGWLVWSKYLTKNGQR